MKITIEHETPDEKGERIVLNDVVEFALVGTRIKGGLYPESFTRSLRANRRDANRLIGQLAEMKEGLRMDVAASPPLPVVETNEANVKTKANTNAG